MNPQEIAALEAKQQAQARLAGANAELEAWTAHHERVTGELSGAKQRKEQAEAELAELEGEEEA